MLGPGVRIDWWEVVAEYEVLTVPSCVDGEG
jgi:hypothetical protein